MTFTPSPYQQAYFDWMMHSTGSAVVIAGPGSGKTTTLVEGLPLVPRGKYVQMFAFNSAIAKTLKARIADLGEKRGFDMTRMRASTFHSVGFGAICKFLGKRPDQVETDKNKMRTIVRSWLGEDEQELYGAFICKLVGLAKGEGIGALVPDTEERWYTLIQYHDLYLDSLEADEVTAVRLARQLLVKSNEAGKVGHIDFDDQLYLPLLWKLRLFQNDWVFVDEAQDTNPVRRAMAKLALRPGGRLVAVGDPRQAIYGFTGASHDALDLIKREFSCKELYLTVCYRCSVAVVEQVRTLADAIEVAPGARQGKVSELPMKEALGILTDRDAVLCRNTAPLMEAAFQLIAAGRGCTVAGRDIADGLVNLIKKMKAKTIEGLEEKLRLFEEREVSKHMAKGEEQKAEGVTDRTACITIVIKNLSENDRTIPKLITKLESLFDEKGNVLTLSTVHKAKGKEWENVAILRPDLMPSRFARQEWQQAQEVNLQWVAWSRPMNELIFLTDRPKPKKTFCDVNDHNWQTTENPLIDKCLNCGEERA